jgi:membrane-bound ClpP family serine protease
VLVGVLAITSGERRRLGSGWWDLFAVGTVLSIAGAALAQAAATPGGVLAIVGAALILVGATIGFPPGE